MSRILVVIFGLVTDVASRLKSSEMSYEEKRRQKLEARRLRKLEQKEAMESAIDPEMAALGFDFTFGGSRKQK